MAQLSISAAARAIGRDRSTIHRALKSGRLSSTLDEQGNPRIDTAELQRVFGPLLQADAPPRVAPVASTDAQEQLLDLMRERVREAEERVREAHEREQWLREQLATLQGRLLPPPPEESPAAEGTPWLEGALAVLVILGVAGFLLAWQRVG